MSTGILSSTTYPATYLNIIYNVNFKTWNKILVSSVHYLSTCYQASMYVPKCCNNSVQYFAYVHKQIKVVLTLYLQGGFCIQWERTFLRVYGHCQITWQQTIVIKIRTLSIVFSVHKRRLNEMNYIFWLPWNVFLNVTFEVFYAWCCHKNLLNKIWINNLTEDSWMFW